MTIINLVTVLIVNVCRGISAARMTRENEFTVVGNYADNLG
jgi:hypothetical protein